MGMLLAMMRDQVVERERAHADLEANGYAVVQRLLSADQIAELTDVCDRVCFPEQDPNKPHSKVEVAGQTVVVHAAVRAIASSPRLLGIILRSMGPNIYVNYAGFTTNPPQATEKKPMEFHQDGGRISRESNEAPDPRYSIKAAVWLTDGTTLGRGNFFVIPGSHLWSTRPARDLDAMAVPVHVAAGDAILFERRVWHTRKPNSSNVTRKVLFLDFAPRWMEPKCPMADPSEFKEPLERQLFGNDLGWEAFAPKKSRLATLALIDQWEISLRGGTVA
jgi:ectoine hydroxylase